MHVLLAPAAAGAIVMVTGTAVGFVLDRLMAVDARRHHVLFLTGVLVYPVLTKITAL